MEFLICALFIGLICGGIGIWFGGLRNRPTAGFWLGFFLGPFGWLLTLLLPSENGSQPSATGAGLTSPEQRGIGRCPACGGGLIGRYPKCPHCASDVFWAGNVPTMTAQEASEEQERQDRLAAEKREQEQRCSAQRKRQREEELETQREAVQRWEERKKNLVALRKRWNSREREWENKALRWFSMVPRRFDNLLWKAAGKENTVVYHFIQIVVYLGITVMLLFAAKAAMTKRPEPIRGAETREEGIQPTAPSLDGMVQSESRPWDTDANWMGGGKNHDPPVANRKQPAASESAVFAQVKVRPRKDDPLAQANPAQAAVAGKASPSRKRSRVADASAEPRSQPPPDAPRPPTTEPAAVRLIPTVTARILDAPPMDADDGTTAQVVVYLSGTGLNLFRRDYLIGWQLTERRPGGTTQGATREILNIDSESSCLTAKETESVVLRFTFARRSRGDGLAPRPVARTAEHSVNVQVGKRYEVRLLLDAETQGMISRFKPD